MTAEPGYQKLKFRCGDPFQVKVASVLPDGTVEDIVAADVLAQIRATFTSEDAVDFDVTVDHAAEIEISPGTFVTGDEATCRLTPAATAAMAPGEYVWDFQPNEDSDTWVAGPVKVSPDVSRPA